MPIIFPIDCVFVVARKVTFWCGRAAGLTPFLICLLLACSAVVAYADSLPGLPSGNAIVASLSVQPRGSAPPCDDRRAWAVPVLQQRQIRIVQHAKNLIEQPITDWSDIAYLSFNKIGDRQVGEQMMKQRQQRLMPLVLAECLLYNGDFITGIESVLRALITQPTWVLPAHDKGLRTLKRNGYFVDLNAADVADEVAQSVYLLRSALAPELVTQVIATLEQRVFLPMRVSFGGAAVPGHDWLLASHNWNPVCLEGVTSAALAVLQDRQDRALFINAAHVYSRKYITGFGADGYASEGLSYWNYGFSHFGELREKIIRATGGKVDLFDDDAVREIALFGHRIVMFPNNAALFGDALPGSRPDHDTMVYLNKSLNLGLVGYGYYSESGKLLTLFPGPPSVSAANTPAALSPVRHYFANAGVLVSRPAVHAFTKLAVTIKAGGNTTHSHNDIGSYAIGMGMEQPVGDPGGVKYYNRETFGPNRYKSKVFNSYGHPVPVVAGRLQSEADKIKVPSPITRFSELSDEIRIDLAVAYAEPTLKSLTRSMRYDRTGSGAVRVEDRFEYTSAQSFETAITSRGVANRIDDTTIEFAKGPERLRARLSASAPYELVEEKVSDSGAEFVRIGIRLRQPAANGYIAVEYLPMQ